MKNVMDLRVFDQNWTPIIWKTRPPWEIVKINFWICFCALQLDPRPMNSSSWNSRSLPTLFVVLLVLAGVREPTGCFVTLELPPIGSLAGLEWWALAGVLGWHAMVASSNCTAVLRLAFSQTLKPAKVQSICRRSLHAQCLVLSCVQKFF